MNKSVILYAGNATANHCMLNVTADNVIEMTAEPDSDCVSVSGGNGSFTIAAGDFADTRTARITFTGIDVSKWQGKVDWAQVATVASFAIIRCGGRYQGNRELFEDPYFKQNIENAQANGLKVGVYFYSTAMNEVEAVEEASMALELVKGYSLSLPIYFDFEDNMQRDSLNKEQRNAIMNAFCRTIQNSGRTAGMYSYTYWLEHYVDMNTLPGNISVWVAQFKAECTYTGRYDIWQYTSDGTVPGVGGRVDMNISYF